MTLNQKSIIIENCCNEILEQTKKTTSESFYYQIPDPKLIEVTAAKHGLRKEFITSILTENN
jgi:hypothetical protein